MIRVGVLASGGGTTFQALLDHVRAQPDRCWSVSVLLSDRPSAGALERARTAGIPSAVVPVTGRSESDLTADLLGRLEDADVTVVALAGYLRLVPAPVVRAYRNRMLNVHPALLPSFGGKGMYGDHVHEAVLSSGVRLTGPTVHWVTDEYDRGRSLAQWPVPVRAGDTVERLRDRVQAAERALYPHVLDRVCAALRAGDEPSPLDWTTDWLVATQASSHDPLTLMRTSCR
ncbi:MAG: phosphoribosylglycinamide formyltransferase [Gemmatimonadota bacterium]